MRGAPAERRKSEERGKVLTFPKAGRGSASRRNVADGGPFFPMGLKSFP